MYSSFACFPGCPLRSTLRVWEVHDDRLQAMARSDASLLHDPSRLDDVSDAWMVWSRLLRPPLLMLISLLEALSLSGALLSVVVVPGLE